MVAARVSAISNGFSRSTVTFTNGMIRHLFHYLRPWFCGGARFGLGGYGGKRLTHDAKQWMG